MKESQQNLIDKQDKKIIAFNEDEGKPLKNKNKPNILKSVIININNTFNKKDENNKDEQVKDKYPIELELDGNHSITIIKTKLKIHWVHHYKEKNYEQRLNILFYIILPVLASINLIGIFQIISVMNALSKVLSNSF